MNTRESHVRDRIEELSELLMRWEKYELTAANPTEKYRSKQEIKRFKQQITEYKKELEDNKPPTHEDKEKPFLSPEDLMKKIKEKEKEIKRNNLIFFVIILFSILLGGIYYYSTIKEKINYDQYLEFLALGDSLIQVNKYEDAQEAYENALRYNKADSSTIQKIELVEKANSLVKENKFDEAKKLFEIVIDIPPSSLEIIESESAIEKDKPSYSSMQIKISWDGAKLLITIRGGAPFDNPNQPYQFENLNCKDCIKWKQKNNEYIAEITGKDISGINIKVRDSKGKVASKEVPTNSSKQTNLEPTPKPESKLTPTPDNSKERFSKYVKSADELFDQKKYTEALKDYNAAQSLDKTNKHVNDKIEVCTKKIKEEAIIKAKNIPKQRIEGGSFSMGSETDTPIHKVTLKSFSIGKYEVTVEQYKVFCDYTNRSMPSAPSYGWNDKFPMTNVTWEDAKAFCTWVGGRLPTEAEWEYAASDGGGKALYSGGNVLDRVAVHKGNSNNQPKNIGGKSPNAFGIYDMTGNVSEWCADTYAKYSAEPQTNPTGGNSGSYKVLRGGSYSSTANSTQDANQLRIQYRNRRKASNKEPYLGFRVAW